MQATPSHSAITLVVTNSERLEGRSTGSHVFHQEGGTLGSGNSDHWLLQDSSGQIRPEHAEIRLVDGRFCLTDRSGHTFINHATLPMGRDRRVALRDGDELGIGEYRLRVHYGDRQAQQSRQQALDVLVSEEDDSLGLTELPASQASTHPEDDPLDALGRAQPSSAQQDPIAALEGPEEDHVQAMAASLIDAPLASATPGIGNDDLQDRQQAAMHMPATRTYEDYDMDKSVLDDLERSVGEQLEDRWQEPSHPASFHVGVSPLLRGLGSELQLRDSEEQQAFLEEAGQTLRATLEGLQRLHQGSGRYPLRDRRLQPIEDNPLRLEQSYAETLETLFSSRRSPVHLSPPAAVGECLNQQHQHQVAIEEAIGQALSAILDAFAPEAMLKRFHAYRRAGQRPEDEDGWAWEMYRYYYQELKSGRQRGFEKLFWEVFEQAYDGSVRRQQREEA